MIHKSRPQMPQSLANIMLRAKILSRLQNGDEITYPDKICA